MPKHLLKVLPTEDQAEFDRLFESCRSEFAPGNLHEDFLVEQMAWSRWRVMRYQRFEDIARANGDLKAAAQMHRIANSAQKSHDQALRDYGKAKDDTAWADKQVKEAEQDLQKAQQRLEQLIQKRDKAQADIATTQAWLETAREKVDAAWANRPQ